MMAWYEPWFCRDTYWKKKKEKRHSLAIEEIRDRPIGGGQIWRKKGTKRDLLVLVGKNGSREILPHLPWFDYENV